MADRVHGWVRVDCERCGSVELPASDVRLVMARPEADSDPRDLVAFHCGTCGLGGTVRVDERAARLVAAAGARLSAPAPGNLPHGPGPLGG